MHLLLMYTPHAPSPRHVERLRSIDPSVRVTVAQSEREAVRAAPTADAIFGHRYLRQVLPHASRLQWVQVTTNGIDRLPNDRLRERGVLLSRFTGSAAEVARHALALALTLDRAIAECVDNQRIQRWTKAIRMLPAPKRALVLGAGRIGRQIARYVRGLDVEVDGVRRAATTESDPDFRQMYDAESWREALPGIDWLFLALPHTAETNGLLDAEALQALPSHALVVNVGRGETVDLKALTAALEAGDLGGAALDVLPEEFEPLADDDPLWQVPNLLLTPHVAAFAPDRPERVEAFVESQLRAYLEGKPLRDVVFNQEDTEVEPPPMKTRRSDSPAAALTKHPAS